jgi:hypothetical protein
VSDEERRLIEKLLRIEALYARPGTEGERVAASSARERIVARLRELERGEAPEEYRFSTGDIWGAKLMWALLRRYGVSPYRYSGQRHTTVMARVSRRFVDETLWPEYEQLRETLERYLEEVTERVIAQALGESDGTPRRP